MTARIPSENACPNEGNTESNPTICQALQHLIARFFPGTVVQETQLASCLTSLDTFRAQPHNAHLHNMAFSETTCLSLLIKGDFTGFIVRTTEHHLKNCKRIRVSFYQSDPSYPYYSLEESLIAIWSDQMTQNQLEKWAQAEQISKNLRNTAPRSPLLATCLYNLAFVVIGSTAELDACIQANIWRAAQAAWESLSRLHNKKILWNAQKPADAILFHNNQFFLSFDSCIRDSEYILREEASESLLFSQHAIDIGNPATLKTSDSARLAFALIQKLFPGNTCFLDAEVVEKQATDGQPTPLKRRKYSCYSTVSRLNADSIEQLNLGPEKSLFLRMLFSNFLPIHPKPLPSLPPEALFAFSLRKTKEVACHIFYQIKEQRRHVSYHVLPQGTFLCEQKLLKTGGSMGLWQQTISRDNQQIDLSCYHLVSRNSEYESTEATHRTHETIQRLGIPGIHPAGTLVGASLFAAASSLEMHFQSFAPNLDAAILVNYAPLGSCKENALWGQFPPAKKEAWLRQLARSLAGLHTNHVLHRDIKPDNILITEDRLTFTDFGGSGSYKKEIAKNLNLPYIIPSSYGTPSYQFQPTVKAWKASQPGEMQDQLARQIDQEAFLLTELDLLFGKEAFSDWFEIIPYRTSGPYKCLKTNRCVKPDFLTDLEAALKLQGYSPDYINDLLQRASNLPKTG